MYSKRNLLEKKSWEDGRKVEMVEDNSLLYKITFTREREFHGL
jgi:hypothetical protein